MLAWIQVSSWAEKALTVGLWVLGVPPTRTVGTGIEEESGGAVPMP